MAVPSFIGSNTQDSGGALSLTFTVPAATTTDDLILVFVKQSENTTQRTWDDDGGGGNGYTRIAYNRTTGGRDQETAVYYKFATSGSEANPTFTWASGVTTEPMSGAMLVYRGVDKVEPYTQITWQWAQNDGNPPNPDVEIDFANTRVVCCHNATHDDITTVAAPTGFTLRTQIWNGTSNDHRNHFTADIEVDTLGTYSPPDWQHSVANTTPEYQTYTIALNEAQPIHVTGGTALDGFSWGDTNLTITGDGFEAVQGTGKVEIWSNTAGFTKVSQTIDSWSDTSIQIDTVQGSLLDNTTLYLVVTNDSGDQSKTIPVTVGLIPYTEIITNLEPDHFWKLNNTYDDTGITGPVRNMTSGVVGTHVFSTTTLAEDTTHSLAFSSVTDRREITDSANMNITISSKERTIMAWIRLGGIQQSLGAIWKEGGGVQNLAFILGLGNVLTAQLADTAGTRDQVQAFSDFRLKPNRTYFILMQYSHLATIKEMRLFIDGIKQTVTDGNPMTLGIFDSHSGDVTWNDPDNNLETGGTDIAYAGQDDILESHWATWSDNSGNTSAGYLTQTEITELFERGAIPYDIIEEDEIGIAAEHDGAIYSDTDWNVYSSTDGAIGQSFVGTGEVIDTAYFWLSKQGTPTGNMVAKVYAATGTHGVDAKPTGAALATSDTEDISTLTTTFINQNFNFESGNRITLTEGTTYILVVEYTGGDASNYLEVGMDSTLSSEGNYAYYSASAWSGDAFGDVCFNLYTERTQQNQIGDLTGTTISDAPLALRVLKPDAASDLELTFDNVTFDDGITLQIQWYGSGTLTLVQRNGTVFDTDKFSTPNNGTITVVNDVEAKITVKDIDTGDPIPSAQVLLQKYAGTQDVCDSYPTSNHHSDYGLYSGSYERYSQSFVGNGLPLAYVEWYLSKSGSPTGNAVAKIYEHSGVFGTSSEPGTLLATSDNLDVSTLTTTRTLYGLDFTGSDKILLKNGTRYVVTIEYADGNASNLVQVSVDETSPTHEGNLAWYISSAWSPQSDRDAIFYVYTDDYTTIINETADSNGQVSTIERYSTDTAVLGRARRATSSSSKTEEYAISNRNSGHSVNNGGITKVSQSFIGNGERLTQIKGTGYRLGTGATGDITVSIFAHSGTYGTSSVPTGSALATSDGVDVSSWAAAHSTKTYDFDGTFVLEDGVEYTMVWEYDGGDGSNYLLLGKDTTTPFHGGNTATYNGSWTAISGEDMVFELYTKPILYKTSPISGTISSSGLDQEVFLIKDE